MAQTQYTAIEVADWFLRKVNRPSGDSINQLKLQVLLYFSEAWSLAVFDRELFDEEIQAWEHGPVVYSVWNCLSMKGWNDLEAGALNSPVDFNAETETLLSDVFQAYAEFPQAELEKMANKDAPWKEARHGLPPWDLTKRPISKATMTRFYKELFESGQAPDTSGNAGGASRSALLSKRYY
jgi:uncharacterized phage-associated protein